jgi:hypothetical protein
VYSVVKKSFEVFFVDENALIACWNTGVNEELVKETGWLKNQADRTGAARQRTVTHPAS